MFTMDSLLKALNEIENPLNYPNRRQHYQHFGDHYLDVESLFHDSLISYRAFETHSDPFEETPYAVTQLRKRYETKDREKPINLNHTSSSQKVLKGHFGNVKPNFRFIHSTKQDRHLSRKIKLNRPLINNVIKKEIKAFDWSTTCIQQGVVNFVPLNTYTDEYKEVLKEFHKTLKKNAVKVTEISRIENPYLLAAYILKKEELEMKYKHVQERLLFHGTTTDKIDLICTENFNWRLFGQSKGHKFGQGISFTPKSSYAFFYCNKKVNSKVMLAVKVLTTRSCLGTESMVLPPLGFDTTHKAGGDVIVKYADNEYYPAYKISFISKKNDCYFHKKK